MPEVLVCWTIRYPQWAQAGRAYPKDRKEGGARSLSVSEAAARCSPLSLLMRGQMTHPSAGALSISNTRNFSFSLRHSSEDFLFSDLWATGSLNTTPNFFVFMITKSSFFKFVFLYNITKLKKKWCKQVWGGIYFKKESIGKLNQGSLFLEYFFWIIQWPRTTNITACLLNFLGDWKGLNQKCNH